MKPFTNDIWSDELCEIGLNNDDTVVCLHLLGARVSKIAHGYSILARDAAGLLRNTSLAIAAAKLEQLLEDAGLLINQASILVRIDENFCNKDNF